MCKTRWFFFIRRINRNVKRVILVFIIFFILILYYFFSKYFFFFFHLVFFYQVQIHQHVEITSLMPAYERNIKDDSEFSLIENEKFLSVE